jgi:hypothetical protein
MISESIQDPLDHPLLGHRYWTTQVILQMSKSSQEETVLRVPHYLRSVEHPLSGPQICVWGDYVKSLTLNEIKPEHDFISGSICQLTSWICRVELGSTHVSRQSITMITNNWHNILAMMAPATNNYLQYV